jgi:hypothetical protein
MTLKRIPHRLHPKAIMGRLQAGEYGGRGAKSALQEKWAAVKAVNLLAIVR